MAYKYALVNIRMDNLFEQRVWKSVKLFWLQVTQKVNVYVNHHLKKGSMG